MRSLSKVFGLCCCIMLLTSCSLILPKDEEIPEVDNTMYTLPLGTSYEYLGTISLLEDNTPEKTDETSLRRAFSRTGIALENRPKKAIVHEVFIDGELVSEELIKDVDNQLLVYNLKPNLEQGTLKLGILSNDTVFRYHRFDQTEVDVEAATSVTTLEGQQLYYGLPEIGKQLRWFTENMMYKKLTESGENWSQSVWGEDLETAYMTVRKPTEISFEVPPSRALIFLTSVEKRILQTSFAAYAKWWADVLIDHPIYADTKKVLEDLDTLTLEEPMKVRSFSREDGQLIYMTLEYSNVLEKYHVLPELTIPIEFRDEEKLYEIKPYWRYLMDDENNGYNLLNLDRVYIK